MNEEFVHNGRPVHVQTEDLGSSKGQIRTLVYCKGQIVMSKATAYADMHVDGANEEAVAHATQKQHLAIIAGIKAGKLDEKINAIG